MLASGLTCERKGAAWANRFYRRRCPTLRAELGIHVLVVGALHEHAAAFYRLYGFRETASNALALYLPLGK
ncbi:hypothetical protein THICB3600060 [Thiomonas sp. CB3]|nr:hypothetical protein THICB3600060 [Thiomonas sp. CB3]